MFKTIPGFMQIFFFFFVCLFPLRLTYACNILTRTRIVVVPSEQCHTNTFLLTNAPSSIMHYTFSKHFQLKIHFHQVFKRNANCERCFDTYLFFYSFSFILHISFFLSIFLLLLLQFISKVTAYFCIIFMRQKKKKERKKLFKKTRSTDKYFYI